MTPATEARLQTASPALGFTSRAIQVRSALVRFFLPGFLLSIPGPLLVTWGYHRESHYGEVSTYLLATAIGIAATGRLGAALVERYGVRGVLTGGCVLGAIALVMLSEVAPPLPHGLRAIGLLGLAISAALLLLGVLHEIAPVFRHNRGVTVNLTMLIFGIGCIATPVLFAVLSSLYTSSATLFLLAAILLLFLPGIARSEQTQATRRPAELHAPARKLFCTILFLQAGNEFTIACWLPLFLIQRTGMNFLWAAAEAALFWLALVIGRLWAQSWLRHAQHFAILGAGLMVVFFGCVILSATNNPGGAGLGVVLVGLGLSPVMAVCLPRISPYYPDFDPVSVHRLLCNVLAGGLTVAWLVGPSADQTNLRILLVPPFLGSVAVMLLTLLLIVEVKLHGIQPTPAEMPYRDA